MFIKSELLYIVCKISFSVASQVQEGGEAQYAADYIVYTLYRGKYSCLLYLQMVGWR